MRVTTLECFGLEAPLERPFGYSQAWVSRRKSVLVRIETADGIEGWGEIYVQVPPGIYVNLVADLFAPFLIGRDPWDREIIWNEVYTRTIDAGQRGLTLGALSGIDIALWDLTAKDAGRPVHQLLGGLTRPSVRAYATGLYRDPDDWIPTLVEEARRYVAEGYALVKMKVGFGLDFDVAAVRAVRQAIGRQIGLAVDANHAYRPAQAVELGRRIADQDLAWFEEPVSPEDLDGYREVRDRQPIPVAGGELAFTRYGFAELFRRRAVDLAQPDLGLVGGLTEAKLVAQLAHLNGVRCWAHVWGTGVIQAAALHFLGWLPDRIALEDVDPPLIEWDRTPNPLRDEIVNDPPVAARGEVAVPRGPGLGVEVNRAAVERFTVAHRAVSVQS